MDDSVMDPGRRHDVASDLAEARRRVDAMGCTYATLRVGSEKAVVRWAWATSGAGFYRQRPLYAERFAPHDRRWLEHVPDVGADADEYGIDKHDRVVVVREHGGGTVHFEEFLAYSDRVVIAHRYGDDAEPVGCRICRIDSRGHVIHHVDAHAGGGFNSERYKWQADRVVCIRHEFDYRTSERARAQGAAVHVVIYDEGGHVAEIRDVTEGELPAA